MEGSVAQAVSKDHSDHDAKWQIHPSCIACVVESLESEQVLTVKRRLVLGELHNLLTHWQEAIEECLGGDLRVAGHIALLCLGHLRGPDESCVSLAGQVLVQLVCIFKSEELVCCVLDTVSQEILKVCNYKKSLPTLQLVGRLLQLIPPLANQLLLNYGSLVDYMYAGLSYPEEAVQGSVAFICLHLYSRGSRANLSLQHSTQIAAAVLSILRNSKGQEVLVNTLGLLKCMLEEPELTTVYLSQGAEGLSLASALKRVLLGRQPLLQVATVQCLSTMLSGPCGTQAANKLLQDDMAEFLFEVLPSSNDLLVGSVFCCLFLFTETEQFFKKCHDVYGLESILRGLEQAIQLQNPQVLMQGMALLANILTRHQSGIRLLSSPSLVKKTLGLITQGLAHYSQHVFLQAARALQAALRREHLLSPVPYAEVAVAIQTVVDHVKSHPRMTCLPAASPRASTTVPFQAKQSKAYEGKHFDAAQKALRTQQRLLCLLSIIAQALGLAVECESDPRASAASFGANARGGDDKASSTLEGFIDLLLEVVDRACIPLTMNSSEHINDSAVYIKLYDCLSYVYKLRQHIHHQISEKLLSGGFISFTLLARQKFRSEVSDNANDFLLTLLRPLLELEEASDEFVDQLKIGLKSLQGQGKDILCTLSQNSHDPVDRELQQVQWAGIVLAYYSWLYQDRLVSAEVLHSYLHTYLRLNGATSLPGPLLRFTVYLYAEAQAAETGLDKDSLANVEPVMQRVLLSTSNVSDWCSLYPAVLKWVFSDQVLAEAIGQQTVRFWLRSSAPHQATHGVDPLSTLVSLATISEYCLHTIVHMLSSSGMDMTVALTGVLEQVLTRTSNPNSHASLRYLATSVPEACQKMLMMEPKPPDENIGAMLNLMCMIKVQAYQDQTNSADLKVAYHVCNLLDSDSGSGEDLVLHVLNFLNCLLLQSLNNNEYNIFSVLLPSASLGYVIESSVEGPAFSSAVMLVTLLLHQHHSCEIKQMQPFRMKKNLLLATLHSADPSSVHCGLQFFTSYLKAVKHGVPLVQLIGSDKRQCAVCNVTGLPLSIKDLRLMLILLQQCIAKESGNSRNCAVMCLESLLLSVSDRPAVVGHLLEQPWHRVLLDGVFAQLEDSTPPCWLLHLLNMFVHHKPLMLRQSHLQLVLAHFLKLSKRDEKADMTVLRQLANLTQQILEQNILKLDKETEESARDSLAGTKTDKVSSSGFRWRPVYYAGVILALPEETTILGS